MAGRFIDAALCKLASEFFKKASFWPEKGVKQFLDILLSSRHVERGVTIVTRLKSRAHKLTQGATLLDVSLEAWSVAVGAQSCHKHSTLSPWLRGRWCHGNTAG